ncbi:MAG: hypothetical protein U1E59_05600 [Amaricoccus sp.]
MPEPAAGVLRLEVGGEPAAAVRRAGLVEGVGEGGELLGGADHHADHGDVVGRGELVDQPGGVGGQDRGDVGVVGVELDEALGGRALALLDQRGEKRLLAVEVDVERALGHLRLAGDLAHAGGGEALGEEDAAGAVEDLLALGALGNGVRRLAFVESGIGCHPSPPCAGAAAG